MAGHAIHGLALPDCSQCSCRSLERALEEGVAPSREIPEAAAMDDIERRAALSQLVDALPADQRRVVVLRFVEQKSIRDISQEKKTEGG